MNKRGQNCCKHRLRWTEICDHSSKYRAWVKATEPAGFDVKPPPQDTVTTWCTSFYLSIGAKEKRRSLCCKRALGLLKKEKNHPQQHEKISEEVTVFLRPTYWYVWNYEMVVSTDTGGYEIASLPGAEIQASVDCMSKGNNTSSYCILLFIA